MKILVTGACGYKGSVLTPKLLERGHEVVAFDIMWFGNHLAPHPKLTIVKGDVRQLDQVPLDGVDAVVHLSSVANDPCSDLDPKLTWEVSCLATMQLADACARRKISRFIYASSGSVYGVSEEPKVVEDALLTPLSEYNKTKMVAERVLLSYSEVMNIQIVRPATVCGLSQRMRLDVAVNLLTMQAAKNGVMTVLGGKQTRPNIHIDDITDLYVYLLDNPKYVGVFNAGFENISILDIASLIQSRTGAEIKMMPSNDPRSYRLDSTKLLNTGFRPKKNVETAIDEMLDAIKTGALIDSDQWYNLKWMQRGVEK
ncbi:NAD-dependent epimerase/dehydratase family protein [Betaproteobacteria bacterium LSUCC0115]|nr:NAD-dependent epimerase/dehydratase family protein [Burkholderiales bacterium LSUCC0115]